MSNWKIGSLDSLSLFGQVELDQKQVSALPDSVLGQIRAGYGRALDRLFPENLPGSHSITFSTKESGHIYVQLDGRERSAGSLNEDPELRAALRKALDISRVHFPESFAKRDEVSLPSVPKKEIIAPTLLDRAIGEIGTACDVNSAVRNSLSVAAVAASTVAISALLGGVGAVYVGGMLLSTGYLAYKKASEIGDAEGKVAAASRMAIGGTFGTFGSTTVAGFLTTAPTTALALGIIGNVGLIGMAGALAYREIKAWSPLSEFRAELNLILDQEIPAEAKAKKGLEFLRSQFTLTEGEMAELESLHTGDALGVAIENRIEEKWSRLVRRVGEDVAKKIVNDVPELLNGDGASIEKAIELLQLVDKSSYTVRVKQIFGLFLSAFYMMLGVLSLVALASPICPLVLPLLFAIGALIWLTQDSVNVGNKIGKTLWSSNFEKRWGRVKNPGFKESMITAYRIKDRWALQSLKRQIELDFERGAKIKINGFEVNSFEKLIAHLELQDLKFDRDGVAKKELTKAQIKALEFMTFFQQGIYGDALTHAMSKKGKAVTGTHSPIYEATFDTEKGEGTVFAPLDAVVRNDDGEIIEKCEVKIYFDGNAAYYHVS